MMTLIVKKRPYETEDQLCYRFVKKVLSEGLLNEIRDRLYYMKPSERKRRKQVRHDQQMIYYQKHADKRKKKI